MLAAGQTSIGEDENGDTVPWRLASDGQPVHGLITGAAGTGKTNLAELLIRRTRDLNWIETRHHTVGHRGLRRGVEVTLLRDMRNTVDVRLRRQRDGHPETPYQLYILDDPDMLFHEDTGVDSRFLAQASTAGVALVVTMRHPTGRAVEAFQGPGSVPNIVQLRIPNIVQLRSTEPTSPAFHIPGMVDPGSLPAPIHEPRGDGGTFGVGYKLDDRPTPVRITRAKTS